MTPPRRTRSGGAHPEDEDKPRAGRMENGSSFTVDGNGPAVERVRISDDADENMPTCGSAMPKPPVDLREEFDDYGNELATDARIWRAYVKEADKCDEDMVDGWNRSLDVILVFAALFSAILTAFAIESAKNLRQDPAENAAASMSEAVSILRAMAAGQYVNSSSNTANNTPEFLPPLSAICVNTLWFLSLSLSVSVSLVAMLAKQWCHSYMSGRTGQSYVQARRRQRRLDGLKRWKMAEILAFLPTLMHLSLILFFIGLTIYLWSIHAAVATPVLAITALTFVFYAVTTILPVGSACCPYSTPLSQYIELALRKILAPIKNTTFAQHFPFRQHESQMSADLANPIPDDLTSRMLAWLISSSQDTRSVDLALQAIAGADSRMPVQPLVQRAVVTCLVRRFIGCFTVHPRTGLASLANDALIETASLYGRALAFVIANAPAQISVASEVQIASGTDQGKKVRSIDKCYSYLEVQYALREPNISAFAAANMSTWREFWGRVAWPWPNVPLARTSEILKRHLKGEITLHPNALAALADTIGVEAPRWLCTRDPWDRGGVAMCLVHLLEHSTQHPPGPSFSSISVALAVFALTVDDYPGGISKPSSEFRATRALGVLRLYDSKQLRLEDYENLLAFGLLGLLKNPGFYSLTSDNITSIASALGSAYRMDKSCTQLPFLPHTFDLEEHLLRIILEYLRPIAKSEQFTIGEEAWSTLLDLLNMQPHIWAHNIQVYDIIAETLERAETGELQKSCLTAIGSQWAHTPLTYLLETLFDHGTFRTLLKLLKGHDPSVALMVMHPLWMMVSKTLELSQNEYVPIEHQAFDASSALRSAVEDGLFFSLGQLFCGPLPGIAPHHVDMWLWVLENLGRIFPGEIVQSNVLISMAVFYESNVIGHIPGLMTVNETGINSADRLRVLHSKYTDIAC